MLVILFGLGGVAFITLLERKLLGLSQIRLGPNKVRLRGLLQPVADGIKLLFKDVFFVMRSQIILFFTGPIIRMRVFVILWVWVLPWIGDFIRLKYSSLLFFRLLGLRAYTVIITGWSRISAFSKLGRLRGILQSLSFEVALVLVFLTMLSLLKGFLLKRENRLPVEVLGFWMVVWILLSLMETNRAPFDLLEGESELIRGFNVEISRILFVYLFLREYGRIIIMCSLFRVVIRGAISMLRGFFLGSCCSYEVVILEYDMIL